MHSLPARMVLPDVPEAMPGRERVPEPLLLRVARAADEDLRGGQGQVHRHLLRAVRGVAMALVVALEYSSLFVGHC